MASKSKYYKHTVLLVDDDPHILDLYCEILAEQGYEITKATSGESAIKELESKHFDLVVTDLNMGQVDGISVLKRAKLLDPETMVIITTGNTDINYAIEALRLHATDYILKPFNVNYFLQQIQQCFGQFENRPKSKKSAA
jgi:DNA-binding NtrC family response regulator